MGNDLQTNLDHWRHEVGKLHSQLDRLRFESDIRIAALEAQIVAADKLAEAIAASAVFREAYNHLPPTSRALAPAPPQKA